MSKYLIAFALVLSTISIISCKETIVPGDPNDPNYWSIPPNYLSFQIRMNGERLPDSILQNITMYYYDENGNKIMDQSNRTDVILDDPSHLGFEPEGTVWADSGIVFSMYPIILASKNMNYMYIGYPDGDVDTIYTEQKYISNAEGRLDPCYCNNPITVLKFNGKDAPIHPTLRSPSGKDIYIFEK